MIVDCDTHYLPPDVHDCMGLERRRPRFTGDGNGCAGDCPGGVAEG